MTYPVPLIFPGEIDMYIKDPGRLTSSANLDPCGDSQIESYGVGEGYILLGEVTSSHYQLVEFLSVTSAISLL